MLPGGGEARYFHRASDRHYAVIERGGKFYQRRHQTDRGGGIFNEVEKEIHFVMGSGNHARTFLHRRADGTLTELPLAWYAENGGSWAMNPGYDRPDHPDFRRAISDDCMFCHNGYPGPAAGKRGAGEEARFPEVLPEGIDCQRCHGPGQEHVKAAGKGPIYNPGKQSRERQMETCQQCHLESTSRALPYAIRRFDRGPYSYRADERLGDFLVHFDYPEKRARESDHFEIAHAAYRLQKSACYVKSGTMVCTSCHDPHGGGGDGKRYTAVCQGCHAQAHAGDRSRGAECARCHMPKRRAEDVVHVVMTDHYIRKRQPGGDLQGPLAEQQETAGTAYRGEVVPYFPGWLGTGRDRELYEATAQVYAGANLEAGIPRLEAAIGRHRPGEPQFYHQLGEAYYRLGKDEAAVRWYREALERDGGYLPAIRNLGATLTRMGRAGEAAGVLRRAPGDAAALVNLGEALLAGNAPGEAVEVLRQAVRLESESAAGQNNLGRALARTGDMEGAVEAFRAAIRVMPEFALAHGNLANALHSAGRWEEARKHFELGLRDGTVALIRYNYGSALAQRGEWARAEALLLEAVRLEPGMSGAHLNLGMIHAMRGQAGRAIPHFQNALRAEPGSEPAQLNLGLALAQAGRTEEAVAALRQASRSNDAGIRQAAEGALRELGGGRK